MNTTQCFFVVSVQNPVVKIKSKDFFLIRTEKVHSCGD